MRLFFLLFFIAVDYYVMLVFFSQKNRRNAFASFGWFIGCILVSKVVTSYLPLTEKYPYNVAKSSLLSILLILFIAFCCQLVAQLMAQTVSWRQEIRERITSLFSYFYFFASLVILWGIWLGPAGRTL